MYLIVYRAKNCKKVGFTKNMGKYICSVHMEKGKNVYFLFDTMRDIHTSSVSVFLLYLFQLNKFVFNIKVATYSTSKNNRNL